jgi:hypothetical protein
LVRSERSFNLSVTEYNEHVIKGLQDWKQRHIKSKLESSIKHLEFCAQSINQYPSQLISHYKILETLSRAYYLLGNNHVDFLEEQKELWETGAHWAEKALYTNEDFKNGVVEYGEYVPALKYVKKQEIGALYWYIANIGKWAKNSGIATSLKYIKLIKEMIRRIRFFEPDYFYAGIDRYWGGYYSLIPLFAGGNLKKSQSFFKSSIRKAPEYLGTKVLYAEYYAQKAGKEQLFLSLLKDVYQAELNKDSPVYPENILEKKRAHKLLRDHASI